MSNYSADAQASSSVAFQNRYNLDVDNLRIHALTINEAAKVLSKEQRNIMRKRERKSIKGNDSKELPKCIEKYDECLCEIREELEKIGSILNEDNDDTGFNSRKQQDRLASLNVPHKKNRKSLSETFTTGETTECVRCLSKDKTIQDLEVQLKNIVQLTETLDDLQRRYDKLERRFHEEVRLKDDALQRPTKVAEKLSELYDNQWTDAFDILTQEMEVIQVIHTLLNTLMTAYDTCQELSSRNFFERVQKAIELPTEAAEISNYKVITEQLKQEIKEFRNNCAPFVVRDVEKAVRPRLQLLAKHQSKEVQEYVTACVEIARLCAVQDPPLVLDAKFTNRFNNNVFKDYTRHGEFVDFMVWPAMLLHKDGPLLSKGVAQGTDRNILNQYDHIQRSQWSHSSEI